MGISLSSIFKKQQEEEGPPLAVTTTTFPQQEPEKISIITTPECAPPIIKEEEEPPAQIREEENPILSIVETTTIRTQNSELSNFLGNPIWPYLKRISNPKPKKLKKTPSGSIHPMELRNKKNIFPKKTIRKTNSSKSIHRKRNALIKKRLSV
jgi:hypothetical protein